MDPAGTVRNRVTAKGMAYNDLMDERAQELLRRVLTLSAEERADVAAELLASLDEPPTGDLLAVQRVWADEIERRARRVLAGVFVPTGDTEIRAFMEGPRFVRYFSPVLKALDSLSGSGRPPEVRNVIAQSGLVPEKALLETLPSGAQSRFDNQLGWARFYLVKADTLTHPNGASGASRRRAGIVLL